MNINKVILQILILFFISAGVMAQNTDKTVTQEKLNEVYETVKTPYKYGLAVVPPNDSKKIDCPTVFRKGKDWYMTYLVYDGRGYETWLAKSDNLLNWENLGLLMSFTDSTDWDSNQKAGYAALKNLEWGGSYTLQKYNGNYWMSYFGGSSTGYEAGLLSIGIAYTKKNPTKPHIWQRLDNPVLKSTDKDVRWWENNTMYKTSVIWDKSESLGYPFIMYYNAKGDSLTPKRGAERIGMAVSKDMINWERYRKDPVLNHHKGITGDAVIQKIDDIWVMFYFGAFWPNGPEGAYNRFACSYDLVNWIECEKDLVKPSEPYDELFAHKSSVIFHDGVVYHFYCSVNKKQQRGIAVATSKEMGKSSLTYDTNQK